MLLFSSLALYRFPCLAVYFKYSANIYKHFEAPRPKLALCNCTYQKCFLTLTGVSYACTSKCTHPPVLTNLTTDRIWTLCRQTIIISSKVHDRICRRYVFKNLWIANQISQNSWEKYITCLLKSVGLKCILMDFWRYQLLNILLSHGFLEIFEKYMSPKIRENIFQSHGSHGFHGFLEIYPYQYHYCRKTLMHYH